MFKQKPAPNRELLKCSLPPREALRLAMQVKPPADWKKAKATKRRTR